MCYSVKIHCKSREYLHLASTYLNLSGWKMGYFPQSQNTSARTISLLWCTLYKLDNKRLFLALGVFPEIKKEGSFYDRLPSSFAFHPHLTFLSFSNNPVQVGPQALEKSIDSSVTSSLFWSSQTHHYSRSTIVMNEQKFTATLQKSAHCDETEFYMKVKRY